MQVFGTMARFSVLIFPFSSLLAGCVSNYMVFIVFVCVVCEKTNRVWKGTTIGINNVVTSLSYGSPSMVLAFLLVHSKAFF